MEFHKFIEIMNADIFMMNFKFLIITFIER